MKYIVRKKKKKYCIFSSSRAHAMDSQGELAVCREFDRNIELVSRRVSEWCLLVLTPVLTPVYNTLIKKVIIRNIMESVKIYYVSCYY